ncbi:winged helix-turn-helix transcriptional regulator [Nonomuraea sp. NPDC050783]|uniref:winged helix-turn-helix transcriptional regulator n=1 Tax=Nonomuraea sp. NPDC050783 TaxID=3154634 RepID=UPI003465B53E
MARRRSYGQYCGLTHALELVGERWALLIVRDLIRGPKRFTDLRQGLPRIPTNVLSARLKELEEAGIVLRRTLPRPAASVVYELTEYGRGLEDIVIRLGRWGARSLGDPGPDDIVTTDGELLALRTCFNPEAARGVHDGWELRIEDVVVHAIVDDGALTLGEGPLPRPGLVMDIKKVAVMKPLLSGETSPDEAVAEGAIHLIGDAGRLDTFVKVFAVTPVPAAEAV